MTIKCIIVDDEPLAIEVLQSYVERVESLELVGSCSNAISAFDLLKKEEVDLLFLDIQMPKLTGIEFLKVLNPAPNVIFTTAYREYAVESYELRVVDYLLKPIAFDRFLMAINKVLEAGKPRPESGAPPLLSHAEPIPDENPCLFLRSNRKMVKLSIKDIHFIESLKDYIRVETTDGKAIMSLQKISYMEQKLPSDSFLRVHKSYIVHIKKISAFSTTNVEVSGKEIPIGRSYKAAVMKVLGDFGIG